MLPACGELDSASILPVEICQISDQKRTSLITSLLFQPDNSAQLISPMLKKKRKKKEKELVSEQAFDINVVNVEVSK